MQLPVKSHKNLYDPQTGVKLLTLREAAEYLDYHPFSVYRLVNQGHLTPKKVGKKTLLFVQEELDRYKSSQAWTPRKGKASITPITETQEELPSQLTASVSIDLGIGLFHGETEEIKDFSWEQIPLIRADINHRYGRKIKDFEINVKSPDGGTWFIKFKPPTIIERLVKRFFKKGK